MEDIYFSALGFAYSSVSDRLSFGKRKRMANKTYGTNKKMCKSCSMFGHCAFNMCSNPKQLACEQYTKRKSKKIT